MLVATILLLFLRIANPAHENKPMPIIITDPGSLFQVSKIPLNFHGGGAALAGSSNGLAIKWICHISGGEHSGQARLGASPLDQVAVGIHFDFSFKWARVRRMAEDRKSTRLNSSHPS